jgi:hypothetical protein
MADIKTVKGAISPEYGSIQLIPTPVEELSYQSRFRLRQQAPSFLL